jgi:hypothetical protein
LKKIGATSRENVTAFELPELALLELMKRSETRQKTTRRERVSFLVTSLSPFEVCDHSKVGFERFYPMKSALLCQGNL